MQLSGLGLMLVSRLLDVAAELASQLEYTADKMSNDMWQILNLVGFVCRLFMCLIVKRPANQPNSRSNGSMNDRHVHSHAVYFAAACRRTSVVLSQRPLAETHRPRLACST
jgi:hypothetical protein